MRTTISNSRLHPLPRTGLRRGLLALTLLGSAMAFAGEPQAEPVNINTASAAALA